MSFRNVRDWRNNRPKLTEWYENVATKLKGFSETAPVN